MTVLAVPKVGLGLHPIRIARNGVITSGPAAALVAERLNMIVNRRLKVHFRNWLPVGRVTNAAGDQTTWRWRAHISPNAIETRLRLVTVPAEDTGAIEPRWYISVTPSGGSVYDNPAIYLPARVPAATTIVPDHFATSVRRVWKDSSGNNLDGNTTYEFALHVVDRARILGLTCYEITRDNFDPATAGLLGVNPGAFGTDSQIFDASISDLATDAHTAWKRQATPHFAWVADGTTAKTRSSATYVNLLDGAAAGWGAGSAGFNLWPSKRGSYNSANVPVTFAVYGSASAGTAGKCRLVTNGATVASITNIGTAGWYTATGNLNSANASDLGVIEYACDGVNTVSIRAVGLEGYLA